MTNADVGDDDDNGGEAEGEKEPLVICCTATDPFQLGGLFVWRWFSLVTVAP